MKKKRRTSELLMDRVKKLGPVEREHFQTLVLEWIKKVGLPLPW